MKTQKRLISLLSSDISFRKLNYADRDEFLRVTDIFWAVSVETGDEYIRKQTPEFIESYVDKALAQETEENTFSLLALHKGEIVGVHILRRFEELGTIGVHVSNLWVAKEYRRQGIAKELKTQGEAWAKSIGAKFMNTHVLVSNERMLAINEALGYEPYKIKLRKKL